MRLGYEIEKTLLLDPYDREDREPCRPNRPNLPVFDEIGSVTTRYFEDPEQVGTLEATYWRPSENTRHSPECRVPRPLGEFEDYHNERVNVLELGLRLSIPRITFNGVPYKLEAAFVRDPETGTYAHYSENRNPHLPGYWTVSMARINPDGSYMIGGGDYGVVTDSANKQGKAYAEQVLALLNERQAVEDNRGCALADELVEGAREDVVVILSETAKGYEEVAALWRAEAKKVFQGITGHESRTVEA